MNSETKDRIYLFDNLRFILIFLVVFGHCIEIFMNNNIKFLYIYIYLFHMPVFVFISGYFFKKKNKNLLVLILTYFIFQFLYLIFVELIYGTYEFSINSIFDPYWIMWYMYCLIFWNLIMSALKLKDKKLYKILIIISIIIALGVGNIKNINMKYSLSRMIFFFPFFVLGSYFRNFIDIKRLKYYKNIKHIKIIIIVLFIVILILTKYLSININHVAVYNSKPYIETGTNELIRLIQYTIGFIFIIGFLILVPNKKYKLSFVGANTKYIYLLHGFIVIVFKIIYNNYELKKILSTNLYMQIGVCFILTILIIFIIISFIILMERICKNNRVRSNE